MCGMCGGLCLETGLVMCGGVRAAPGRGACGTRAGVLQSRFAVHGIMRGTWRGTRRLGCLHDRGAGCQLGTENRLWWLHRVGGGGRLPRRGNSSGGCWQDAGGRPASTNSAFSCSSLLRSHLLSLTRGLHVWGRKHAQQQRVLHACVWMEARITSSAALGCKREGRRSPDARLLSTRSCEIGDQWHPYGG